MVKYIENKKMFFRKVKEENNKIYISKINKNTAKKVIKKLNKINDTELSEEIVKLLIECRLFSNRNTSDKI